MRIVLAVRWLTTPQRAVGLRAPTHQASPRSAAAVGLLLALGRVPDLRRALDASFFHRRFQFRRGGKCLGLFQTVKLMNYCHIMRIVCRLIDGLVGDTQFLLGRCKGVKSLPPGAIVR